MNHRSAAVFVLMLAFPCLIAHGQEDPSPITLKQIMADPDWVARSPENGRWAPDSSMVYYERKRQGSEIRDTFSWDPVSRQTRKLDDEQLHRAPASFVLDGDGVRALAVFDGDVFLHDTTNGTATQLTRTVVRESSPMFMADKESIAYRRGGDWFVLESSGSVRQAADVRVEDDPLRDEKGDSSYLEAQQARLFQIVRDRERRQNERDERARERRAGLESTVPGPFYIGKDQRVLDSKLSPSGRWLLLRLAGKSADDPRDEMPAYINDDGMVSTSSVRPKVGYSTREPERLVLLDLFEGVQQELDLAVLPMIDNDPLAWLRVEEGVVKETGSAERDVGEADEAESNLSETDGEKADRAGNEPRPVGVMRMMWNRSGTHAAIMLRSHDNKDRWIAMLSPDEGTALVPVHHLRDEAWINWSFNEMGWTDDSRWLWYISEETGYSHLYVYTPEENRRWALTEGEFEVSRVRQHPQTNELVFRANRRTPRDYGVFQISPSARRINEMQRLYDFPGSAEDYAWSPNGRQLLLRRSASLMPPELCVLSRPGSDRPFEQITRTSEPEWHQWNWVEPEFVEVPSRTGRVIHTKVYRPVGEHEGPRPVVMFVHGAGYTQNSDDQWPYYFREQMFHTLLANRGYLVLDMDYRASAGYGRDWRTAIYRNMGTPELEDFEDGINWAVENADADPERVGIYGGSYGGFMTLMALFKRPDLFACGAALRPVTDWAHYNHGYTSNILNTPELDPEAFEVSSPIEFADGLEDPLLICHGMLDDNVVAQDSIRLAQKLIELEKEDWEMALYPVEPHGFREPTGWLDEYRRILKLFEDNLSD